MIMPNFLIIGAAKAGTTSLYMYLRQHPQVYMSSVKETNFFALEGKTIDYYYPASKNVDHYFLSCKTDLSSYQKLFEKATEKAIGEVSPMYLYDTKAPERIQQYIPDVKLIAILRNPIERAYSSYLHTVRDNLEPLSDFNQAIQDEENRMRNNWWWGFFYVHPGFYFEQVNRYFQRFKRDQIRIYLYEDFNQNPVEIIQDIFRFLQIKEDFVPDISAKYNATGIPINKFLYRTVTQNNLTSMFLKLLLPNSWYESTINTIKNRSLVKPEIDLEIKNKLREVYREDVLKLQDLIQQDLSKWLK